MNQTPMPEAPANRVADLQAESVPLGLGDLAVTLSDMEVDGPDEDCDLRVFLTFCVTNTTASDVESLDYHVQVLTLQGLILDEYQETEQETLPAGESRRFQMNFLLDTSLFEPDTQGILVAMEVTGCDYGQHALGELAVSEVPLMPSAMPAVTIEPALRLVSGALWRGKTDEEGGFHLEIRGLVRNLTAHALPEVILSAVVTDKKGRGVKALGPREMVYPGALLTLSDSGYITANLLKGGKIVLSLHGYWPVARGTWCDEVDFLGWPFRPRGTVPAVAGHKGVRLLFTGRIEAARYGITDEKGLTVPERRAALQRALEQDLTGTLTEWINGELGLEGLEEEYRQLIALPREVKAIKPLAVRGDWEIEDDVLVLNLEADWVLPLTAWPEDVDDLVDALSRPAYPALRFRSALEGLRFRRDSRETETFYEIEGNE